ncbi:hypothetical protein [Anaeromyxobacter sp. Fw109-5]|uniref:hypothetical protein n=1 Tax=Anaeromyxobacter sp. (strain Fw109-5) TaxID=404589 RepID=UPI00117CC99C|nr:hypothetical protein [Anaeromyxobacter sp. Fw109-5]
MPPRSLGDRGHLVRVDPLEAGGWAVVVKGGVVATFSSEPEARASAERETLRLDAVAGALLRRVRRGLRRK